LLAWIPFGCSVKGNDHHMRMTLAATLLLSVSLAAPAAAAADRDVVKDLPALPVAPNLLISVGASDWSGDFGATTNTNIGAVLVGVRYKLGPIRLTASLPWMRIDSYGAVFAGVEGTPLIASPGGSRKHVREGLADLTLGASYVLPTNQLLGLDVEANARVKVPTASAGSGLSTGKVDYSVGSEISKTVRGFTPFASVNYRHFGDPTGWNFRDGFAASVGLSYVTARYGLWQVSYDYAQRTSIYIPDSHEVVGGVSAPITGSRFRLTGFIAKGLSNGAADWSGGLSLAAGW
jgi:hypothetical protein